MRFCPAPQITNASEPKAGAEAVRRRNSVAARCGWVLLQAACVLGATGAQAQTAACDMLKASLAARIDASAGAFMLEAVPSDTPVPPGAKVVGRCQGNTYKVLLRRGGAAAPAAPGASGAAPSPGGQPQAASPATDPARRMPQTPPARTPPPPPAASPAPAALVRVPDTASAVAASPSVRAPAAAASTAADVPGAAPAGAAPGVSGNTVQAEPLASDDEPGDRGAVAFFVRHWPWAFALALFPLATWLWVWRRRRYYDEAGLPRGPRLD